MNTYTWEISGVQCKPQAFNKNDVVSNVIFRVAGTDGTHYVTQMGSVDIPYDANTTFKNFSDLSETEIVEWVKAALGKDGVKNFTSELDERISRAAIPQIVAMPLPWTKG